MAYLAAAAARFYAGRWDDALAELEAGQAVIDDTGNRNFVLYYARAARPDRHPSRRPRDGAGTLDRRHPTVHRLAAHRFGADWLFGAQAEFLAATGQARRRPHGRRGDMGPDRTRPILSADTAPAASSSSASPSPPAATTSPAPSPPNSKKAPADHPPPARPERPCCAAASSNAIPTSPSKPSARYRQTPLRPDLAACCEDAAGVLAAAGRRDEAVALLHEAAAIHADIGAAADAARVDARPARSLACAAPGDGHAAHRSAGNR